MGVSEAEEVKQLREEHARLGLLVADLRVDKDALPPVIRKTLGSQGSWRDARKCSG